MRPSSIPAPLSGAPAKLQPIESTRGANAPQRIGERYLVREVLGRGGMAVVYRVTDGEGGRELALKQLQVSEMAANRAAVEQLFE